MAASSAADRPSKLGGGIGGGAENGRKGKGGNTKGDLRPVAPAAAPVAVDDVAAAVVVVDAAAVAPA